MLLLYYTENKNGIGRQVRWLVQVYVKKLPYIFFDQIFNTIKKMNHFLIQLPRRKGTPSKQWYQKIDFIKTKTKKKNNIT